MLFVVIEEAGGAPFARDVLDDARRFLLRRLGDGATDSTEATLPRPGSYALVRIEAGHAVLAEVLADPDTPRAELYEIFAHNGCTPVFSDAVAAELEGWCADPGIDDPSLVDLTALPFVTIDGASSKDLDQAAVVVRDAEGFTVYYALADASYYVRPGTAIWEEAIRRAASYYLPGVMMPMLPPQLCEGLVSLNPHVERRALVLRTRLHADGTLRESAAEPATVALRARIRSRGKLSFEGVQAFYAGAELCAVSPGARERADGGVEDRRAVEQSLRELRELGLARCSLAEERQVVRYRRVELDVKLGEQGKRRFVAAEAIRHPVESYNEQLSLLCNSEGARLLQRAATDPLVEPIYRVHPPPEVARLEQLRALTQALAQVHGLPQRWVWRAEQTLADYLEQLPDDPVTDGIKRAIDRQAVMVNVASNFQSLPEAHHGVGAEVYARFSAPMREIVGVFLHRELWQAISRHALDDKQLRDLVIERANQAKQLQRRLTNEANLIVLDQIFGEELAAPVEGRGLSACVVGLSPSKIYVLFERFPIDAKLHLRDLRNQLGAAVRVSADGCSVYAGDERICRVGDRVNVVVQGHDVARRHWQLGLGGLEVR